jgi:ribosomal protein L24
MTCHISFNDTVKVKLGIGEGTQGSNLNTLKYRITAYILFCIMSTSTGYLKSLDYYMIG